MKLVDRVLLSIGLVLGALGCTPAEDGATVCNEGESIFCRCPGGAPGTKSCNAGGKGFGSCGPCDPRPDSGPGGPGSGGWNGWGGDTGSGGYNEGGSVGTGGGGGAGGGVTAGTEPLLSPCESNGDCESALCRFGYCTKTCTLVSDCPYPQSECIAFDASTTMCMPSCHNALACAPFGAPPNQCGYTHAVDNWGVTVCGEWGAAHELVPLATDCVPFDHEACNLGYAQKQLVCNQQGVCATGCYAQADCPTGTSCSSAGTQLGQCQ